MWRFTLAVAVAITGCSQEGTTSTEDVTPVADTVETIGTDLTPDVEKQCGDGECNVAAGESALTCPEDCCRCGDGACMTAGCGEGWVEQLMTCATDCAECGNSQCDPGEGPVKCPEDCCGICGDGQCKGGLCGENPEACPQDCAASECGNLTCEPGENPVDCPADCEPYQCGNATCEPGENPEVCPQDCAASCGDCECGGSESYSTCPQDCGFCGDGYCFAECTHLAEWADTCPKDCCEPDCGDRVCGPDGCGGSCGKCNAPKSCADGECVCQPKCEGKACGLDGCGGSCGSCDQGEICGADYNCHCMPSCDGKLCGDDGCGGSCGDCAPGESCNAGLCTDCCPGVTALAAGWYHTCAVNENGAAHCWGFGSTGELGYGNTEHVGGAGDKLPSEGGQLDLGGKVAQISAGLHHTCALLDSGDVRCWGDGSFGKLGQASLDNIGDTETPGEVSAVDLGGQVTSIAAGGHHSCAVVSSGKVRCWGLAQHGQLGYGNADNIGAGEKPGEVDEVDVGGDVKELALGLYHTCALGVQGEVRCWGDNSYGQLGYGNYDGIGLDGTPAGAGTVEIGGPARKIAAGHYHTCALLETDNIICWGLGAEGQLGYGSTSGVGGEEKPASAGNVDVGGLVKDIAAGTYHTCAVLTTGKVLCWGDNAFGQLGYGHEEPVGNVEPPVSAGVVDVGGLATGVVAGDYFTCAILEAGTVRCWGDNAYGQLGYGGSDLVGDDEPPSDWGPVELCPCQPICPTCNCQPDCAGKECGDDGCGGLCGSCPGNLSSCIGGACICDSSCVGLECGPDGCGDSCGECAGDQDVCLEGFCTCLPDCHDKECGDDGCGGPCGSCPTGWTCGLDDTCYCEPDCGGVDCGYDGCFGVCGQCDNPQFPHCIEGLCTCAPDCEGKECGPDMCTGDCGKCPGLQICNVAAGVCNSDYPLPTGLNWHPVGVSPLPQVPLGCGTAAFPCNQGSFNFVWVPDSGQLDCFDNEAPMAECPGTAELAPCALTAYCGQDGQHGLDEYKPGWDADRFATWEETPGQPIVTDGWTGLLWQDSFQDLTWDQAVGHCAGLGDWAGFSGWRLPSSHELMSLLQYNDGEVKSGYPGMPEHDFWSADIRAEKQDEEWVVSFVTGAVVAGEAKTDVKGVRCVTDVAVGDPGQRFYFANTGPGDKVVFDSRSGLIWQHSSSGNLSWHDALQHCEASGYGGRDDWRLPNVLELASLLDTTRWMAPFIDAQAFPLTPTAPFFTSTTVTEADNYAWKVHFDTGPDRIEWITKTAELDVRCVTDAP